MKYYEMEASELRDLCKEHSINTQAMVEKIELVEALEEKDRRYESMKVPELRSLCKLRGINTTGMVEKRDMINALNGKKRGQTDAKSTNAKKIAPLEALLGKGSSHSINRFTSSILGSSSWHTGDRKGGGKSSAAATNRGAGSDNAAPRRASYNTTILKQERKQNQRRESLRDMDIPLAIPAMLNDDSNHDSLSSLPCTSGHNPKKEHASISSLPRSSGHNHPKKAPNLSSCSGLPRTSGHSPKKLPKGRRRSSPALTVNAVGENRTKAAKEGRRLSSAPTHNANDEPAEEGLEYPLSFPKATNNDSHTSIECPPSFPAVTNNDSNTSSAAPSLNAPNDEPIEEGLEYPLSFPKATINDSHTSIESPPSFPAATKNDSNTSSVAPTLNAPKDEPAKEGLEYPLSFPAISNMDSNAGRNSFPTDPSPDSLDQPLSFPAASNMNSKTYAAAPTLNAPTGNDELAEEGLEYPLSFPEASNMNSNISSAAPTLNAPNDEPTKEGLEYPLSSPEASNMNSNTSPAAPTINAPKDEPTEEGLEYPLSFPEASKNDFNTGRISFPTPPPPASPRLERGNSIPRTISFVPNREASQNPIILHYEKKQRHRKESLKEMDVPLNSSIHSLLDIFDDLSTIESSGYSDDGDSFGDESPKEASPDDGHRNDSAVPAPTLRPSKTPTPRRSFTPPAPLHKRPTDASNEEPGPDANKAPKPRRKSSYTPPAPLRSTKASKERRQSSPAIPTSLGKNNAAHKDSRAPEEEETKPNDCNKEWYLRSLCRDQGINTTGMDKGEMVNALNGDKQDKDSSGSGDQGIDTIGMNKGDMVNTHNADKQDNCNNRNASVPVLTISNKSETTTGNTASGDERSPASPANAGSNKIPNLGAQNEVDGKYTATDVEAAFQSAPDHKWNTTTQIFGGTMSYITREQKVVTGKSINKAIEKFHANPTKYAALVYQTNLKHFPTKDQKYTFVMRKGTSHLHPQGVTDDPKEGWMTVLIHRYQHLPPFHNNRLPEHDPHTRELTHKGQKLPPPILPGRGMGHGDTPALKIIGYIDPSDIHQGEVGDCWLLAAISAVAEFDGAIKRLFRKTKNLDEMPRDDGSVNFYTITLYDLQTWEEVDIVIDESLCASPTYPGQLLGSKPSDDGELWVPYLEKALAIHCGGWDAITGGQCIHAWALMTGCKEQYTCIKNPFTGKFGCYGKFNSDTGECADHYNSPKIGTAPRQVPWPRVGGGGSATQKYGPDIMYQKICAWDSQNFIVGAGTKEVLGAGSLSGGMATKHAYSVIDCHPQVAGTRIDLLKVRNPWGKGEIQDGEFDDEGPGWDRYPQIKAHLKPVVADDGIFYLTKEEFFQLFDHVYISASNMTALKED